MMTTTTTSRFIRLNSPRHNYMRMAMCACIALPLLALSLCITITIILDTIRGMHPEQGPRPLSPGQNITVGGCPQEDSCSIDYRGDGTWTITRP